MVYMNLLNKATHFFDRTIDTAAILAGFLLNFVMLIVGADVVLRYVVGCPLDWVKEITEYILLFIPFLVAAWVLKREEHVNIDLVLSAFDQSTQALVNTITSFIAAIVCLLLTWYGAKATWYFYQTDYLTPTVLRLPKYIIISIIFIGSFLLCVQFLRRAFRFWESRKTPYEVERKAQREV